MQNGVITKARINLRDGLIELEGSETFVATQLDLFSDIIKNSVRDPNIVGSQPYTSQNTHTIQAELAQSSDEDRYIKHFGVNKKMLDQVIHTDEQSFDIITKIKGTTTQKQEGYCLLYCLANGFYGATTTSSSDLRSLCEKFSCLDSKNFSSNLQARKSYFIVRGQAGSKNKEIQLTEPGKDEARKIIQSLCKAD